MTAKIKSEEIVTILGIHPNSLFFLIQFKTGEFSVYSGLDLSEFSDIEELTSLPELKFDIIT